MEFDYKNIFKRLKARSESRSRDPFRDWKIAVVSFLVLNVAVVVASLYLFWMINTGSMFSSGLAEQPKTEELNQKALHDLVTEFEAKRAAFELLQTAAATSSDPSL